VDEGGKGHVSEREIEKERYTQREETKCVSL